MKAAIEIEALRKTFRDGVFKKRFVPALREVSFTVEEGSIFGLLGPNGAGKTTLIKILLGLVYKSGGSAALLGRPAGDRIGRSQVGYLPEHHRIPRHHTGNSALAYYGGLSGLSPGEVRNRRPELLGRVGLSKWGNMSVRKYSKGMLQRLGLAQAMLHRPKLLILDEPTDGVDPVGRTEMRRLLQNLKAEGHTIFINSHLLQEVELVCDRVGILVQGELRGEGSIETITRRERPDVEFLVRGEEQKIQAALPADRSVALQVHVAGILRFTVPSPEQTEVNRLIDELRKQQLDLIAVTPKKDSLEDVFLNIVSGNGSEKPGEAESSS